MKFEITPWTKYYGNNEREMPEQSAGQMTSAEAAKNIEKGMCTAISFVLGIVCDEPIILHASVTIRFVQSVQKTSLAFIRF